MILEFYSLKNLSKKDHLGLGYCNCSMLPCFVYTWLNKCIGFMTIKKFYYITLYYSFEHCLATFLGKRLQRAIEFTQLKNFWPSETQPTIVVSGGVACNARIRSALEKVRKLIFFVKLSEDLSIFEGKCSKIELNHLYSRFANPTIANWWFRLCDIALIMA